MMEFPREIQTTQENLVFANEYLKVFDNDVVFADGQAGKYLRLSPPGAGNGAVVMVEAAGSLLLVHTFRYPIGAWEWALPRGFNDGEDSLTTACRELAEETGIMNLPLTRLGTVTPDSGLLSTHVDVYLGELNSQPGSLPRDNGEVVGLRWVPRRELMLMIKQGDVSDAFTLAALTLREASRA